VFNDVSMEGVFVQIRCEVISSEMSEYLRHVCGGVLCCRSSVIEIGDDANIEHVREDVVHGSLKSGRTIYGFGMQFSIYHLWQHRLGDRHVGV
jgi:hypothetical protein